MIINTLIFIDLNEFFQPDSPMAWAELHGFCAATPLSLCRGKGKENGTEFVCIVLEKTAVVNGILQVGISLAAALNPIY